MSNRWLEKETLIKRIIDLEPNYKVARLRHRSAGQLYNIYQYLLDIKRPRPTAKRVSKNTPCEVTYENKDYTPTDYGTIEEFLTSEEIESMYPEGSMSKSPTPKRLIIELYTGDGYKKNDPRD